MRCQVQAAARGRRGSPRVEAAGGWGAGAEEEEEQEQELSAARKAGVPLDRAPQRTMHSVHWHRVPAVDALRDSPGRSWLRCALSARCCREGSSQFHRSAPPPRDATQEEWASQGILSNLLRTHRKLSAHQLTAQHQFVRYWSSAGLSPQKSLCQLK